MSEFDDAMRAALAGIPDPVDVDPNACAHDGFTGEVNIARLDGAGKFIAEIKVSCAACGLPFRFLGPPTGISFLQPTVDVVATTLHAPIAPGERALADIPQRLSFTT